MRKLLLFTLLFGVYVVNAQKYLSLDSLVKIRWDDGIFLTEPYITFHRFGESTIDLLSMDVVRYHELHDRYNTDLKRKVFEESEEGQNFLAEMKLKRDKLLQQNCCIMLSPGVYNLKTHCFETEYSVYCGHYAKIPNYENFGIVCLTHFPIQLKRTYLGLRDSPVQKDYRFKISIPLADEKIALDIEENIKNCSLLFIFKIQRTEEKETEFIKQDFILGKISNVYLVNNNTGFIYKKW